MRIGFIVGLVDLLQLAPAGEEGAVYGNYSSSRSISALTRCRFALLAAVLVTLLLPGCATPQSNWTPTQLLELRSSPAVATVHFPAGVYSLDRTDADGYYYRAPRQVIKHSFAGPQPYNGGIFVSRRDPRKLRGYIVWAGGWTKIGNLSGEPHEFIR